MKTCQNDLSSHYIKVNNLYKSSAEVYVVELVCTIGVNVPYFRLFLYTKSNGLQVEPLNLEIIQYSGKSKEFASKWTGSLVGWTKYDVQTRELSIIQSCDVGYEKPDCGSLSKYELSDGRFALKEVLVDLEDDNQLRYVRVYP